MVKVVAVVMIMQNYHNTAEFRCCDWM